MASYGSMIQRTPGTDPLVPQPVKGSKMAPPDAATLKKLKTQGKATPNASGDPSFPIRNGDDLDKAIKAVGRVRPNTDAARAKVRRYIMGRAKDLGLSSRIPDSWNADGSLKDDGSGDSNDDSDSNSGPDNSDDSNGGDDTSDDDLAAATQKLIAKGMSPKVARIFAARAAAKKVAA